MGETGAGVAAPGTGAAVAADAGANGAAGATGTPAAFDWKSVGLDEGTSAFVTEKGWKSPADTIGSYRQLETAFGVPPERLIKLPAPRDAGDPKVWEPIFDKMGRPATADKYVVPLPEGDTGEFAGVVKPIFHKAGLSQSQVTQISDWWNGFQAEQVKAHTAATELKHTAEVTALKQEWGPDYDAKAALVDRAAETFGMTHAHLAALKATMGPKAAMTFLHNIGSKVGVEDTTVPGITGQGAGFGAMTPEGARAKIAEYSKPGSGFAQLMVSKDPKQRMEAQAEWNKLHQLASPAAPAR